jgi:hypothetical protein
MWPRSPPRKPTLEGEVQMAIPERTRVERPKVEITTPPGEPDHLVITRGDGRKCTTHEIRGDTEKEKIVNVVTDLLNDRRTAEHLP